MRSRRERHASSKHLGKITACATDVAFFAHAVTETNQGFEGADRRGSGLSRWRVSAADPQWRGVPPVPPKRPAPGAPDDPDDDRSLQRTPPAPVCRRCFTEWADHSRRKNTCTEPDNRAFDHAPVLDLLSVPPFVGLPVLQPAQGVDKVGWGGRIRTSVWRNQNPLPYHLATPHGRTYGPIIPCNPSYIRLSATHTETC
jgi:hypothetical protein